jgi:hypothetical protein
MSKNPFFNVHIFVCHLVILKLTASLYYKIKTIKGNIKDSLKLNNKISSSIIKFFLFI